MAKQKTLADYIRMAKNQVQGVGSVQESPQTSKKEKKDFQEYVKSVKTKVNGKSCIQVLKGVYDTSMLEDDDEEDRNTGGCHPSEISGRFCAREWCLLYRNPEYGIGKKITAKQKLTFSIGTQLHLHQQRVYAKAGTLYGVYECARQCDNDKCLMIGFLPQGCMKNKDIKARWEYKEVKVWDLEGRNITGHTDGIQVLVVDEEKKKYIWEFKSANDWSFKEVKKSVGGPYQEHKEQSYIYWDTLEKNQEKGIGLTGIKEIDELPFSGVIIEYLNKDSSDIERYVLESREEKDAYIATIDPELQQCIMFKKSEKRDEDLPPVKCAGKVEGRNVGCKCYEKCFEIDGRYK